MKLLISCVLESWIFGFLPGVLCSSLKCRGDERASEIPQMLELFMTKAGNVSQLSLQPWMAQATLIHWGFVAFDSLDGVFVLLNGFGSWDDYVQWVNSWNELHWRIVLGGCREGAEWKANISHVEVVSLHPPSLWMLLCALQLFVLRPVACSTAGCSNDCHGKEISQATKAWISFRRGEEKHITAFLVPPASVSLADFHL